MIVRESFSLSSITLIRVETLNLARVTNDEINIGE